MNRKCPVCDSSEYKSIYEIKMILPEEYHLPNGYDVVTCESCGFCLADTSASLADYNHYYGECNVYSGTPVGEEEWNELHFTAGNMINDKLGKDEPIMDMGFGKGNFLRYLKKKGYSNIFGIDPSPDSVNSVKKSGIEAFVGSIFEEPDKNQIDKYKCVALFDVLEHLLYPKEAIINLGKYIKDDGYMIISVPNYNCLKYNNNPITNMFNQEHINYFSEQSLDNIMFECGYVRVATNVNVIGENEEIIAMYTKSDVSEKEILKDNHCKTEIEAFINKFDIRKNSIDDNLNKLKKDNIDDIYVWGTGAFTMWLLANTVMSEFNIRFIDNNALKKGHSFWKGTIDVPGSIDNEKAPIVICSMLYANQIKEQIEGMGLNNTILIV